MKAMIPLRPRGQKAIPRVKKVLRGLASLSAGLVLFCELAAGGDLPPPVDLATWDLASWRAWPFEYEELGKREAPLGRESSSDGRISVLCKEKFGGPSPAKGSGGQYAHAPLVAQNADAPSSDWVHVGDRWVAESERKVAGGAASSAPAAFKELEVTEFYLTGGGDSGGPNRIFCASAVPKGVPGPFPVLLVFHGGEAMGAEPLRWPRRETIPALPQSPWITMGSSVPRRPL